MLTLSAKIRKEMGRKVKILREKGLLPAVLYGPGIKNLNLEVNLKEFEKVLETAGESSLISLEVETPKGKPSASYGAGKKYSVLIQDIQRDSLTEKPFHVDFYLPSLKEKIGAKIPLIFEGESIAVKELGGTLVKNISELEIKALPQNLPKEIRVNIEKLRTFKDNILISDLILPEGIEILRGPEEIVATVALPEKVEEELVKPVEEKVEEVEKVEKEKKEEDTTRPPPSH